MVESSIRVFVVDDQALVRNGLVRLLGDEDGIEIVGEAEDRVEALRQIPSARSLSSTPGCRGWTGSS